MREVNYGIFMPCIDISIVSMSMSTIKKLKSITVKVIKTISFTCEA